MTSPLRRLQATAGGLLAMLGIACVDATALPAGSERFDPPPEYRLWWQMTESCSELRGSFADIEWSVVPGTVVLPGTNGEFAGEWYGEGNRIVLASGAQLDGSLVRHEMLHALVRDSGHPRFAFLERCAGTVVCADACMRDAGPSPAPPANTPLVPASALDVGVSIEPAPASASTFGGYFAVVVTARNPANHAVVVQLPPYGNDNLGISFEYLIGTDSTPEIGSFDVAYDPEAMYFRPGETKRELFDLAIGKSFDGRYPPGNYTARGDFGHQNSTRVPFTLLP